MLNLLQKTLTCVILQSVLGAEGLSLAFRHIISSLLWYCSQHSSEEVLHEVIICVGYFTVNNPDNQVNQLKTATTAQKYLNKNLFVNLTYTFLSLESMNCFALCTKPTKIVR